MCQIDPWENAGAISRPVVQGFRRTVNLPVKASGEAGTLKEEPESTYKYSAKK